jgi:hypothetical protein
MDGWMDGFFGLIPLSELETDGSAMGWAEKGLGLWTAAPAESKPKSRTRVLIRGRGQMKNQKTEEKSKEKRRRYALSMTGCSQALQEGRRIKGGVWKLPGRGCA